MEIKEIKSEKAETNTIHPTRRDILNIITRSVSALAGIEAYKLMFGPNVQTIERAAINFGALPDYLTIRDGINTLHRSVEYDVLASRLFYRNQKISDLPKNRTGLLDRDLAMLLFVMQSNNLAVSEIDLSNLDAESAKEIILKNNLMKPALMMGSRGNMLLSRLDISPIVEDREEDLYRRGRNITKETLQAGFVLVEDGRNLSRSLLAVRGGDNKVHEFYLRGDVSKEQKAWSIFILNRLDKLKTSIEKTSTHPSQSILTDREYISLMSSVYDVYRDFVSLGSGKSDAEFFTYLDKLKVQDAVGVSNSAFKVVTLRESLSNRQDELDFKSAITGDYFSFLKIIDKIEPGNRRLLHRRIDAVSEPRSYSVILNEYFSGKDRSVDGLVDCILKYSGNLFLISKPDMYAERYNMHMARENSDFYSFSKDILAGSVSLMDYADRFFGVGRSFVFDKNGNLNGIHSTGKISEPSSNYDPMMFDVIKAIEGNHWEKGGQFLINLFGKNALAAVKRMLGKDAPTTGASSPEMTIIESIFPSPFDLLSSVSNPDGMYPFRRPDLYGKRYLLKLYSSLRDGVRLDDLYDFENRKRDTISQDSNTINRLCAKFESALLARDFAIMFGDNSLMELFVQYVPIGSAKGVQIYGLEAGSKYYFNKQLQDLNAGEMCALVGLIQGPVSYAPVKNDGGYDNQAMIDRAKYVAGLVASKTSLNLSDIANQIDRISLNMKVPSDWTGTFDIYQIDELRGQGVLNNPINIGCGVGVVYQDESRINSVQQLPLPKEINPYQHRAEAWFSGLLVDNPIRIVTTESSRIATVLGGVTDVLTNLDPLNWKKDLPKEVAGFVNKRLSGFHFQELNSDGNPGNKNLNPYDRGTPKYFLYNQLFDFTTTKVWQCGQCALLLNSISRMDSGYEEPMFLGPGGVENWAGILDGKGGVDLDYFEQGNFEAIRFDHFLSENTGTDRPSLLEVGDMVVAWTRHADKTHRFGDGHVVTVVGKGTDNRGKVYIEILDVNYNGTGQLRKQLVWDDSFSSSIFPGSPRHMVVIRPKHINHGEQVRFDRDSFLDAMTQMDVAGTLVTVPTYTQRQNQEGEQILISNPGVAISSFDNEGESFIDPTGIIGRLPILPGNGLKPFVYSFLRDMGVDTQSSIPIVPGEWALDGSNQWVANAASIRMNTDPGAKVSLDQALSCGIDVPFQMAFVDLQKKMGKRAIWLEFQKYLSYWGVGLVSWDGSEIKEQTPLAAIGRDVYVPSLDALGFGLFSLLKNSPKVKDILLNQDMRDSLLIGDEYPLRIDVINDPSSQTIANAVVSFGHKVWMGTRFGNVDTGVVISDTDFVSVGATTSGSENISRMYRRVSSIAKPGLALTMLNQTNY